MVDSNKVCRSSNFANGWLCVIDSVDTHPKTSVAAVPPIVVRGLNMSLSNGFDTRASSLVGAVDAAIERVVAHFEDNDIALRADVLRALAAQAKLAFETERVRQRLRQHPLTRDLIDAVSTRSTAFARLDAGLSVQAYSCEYDVQRNVEILATVQWLLAADEDGAATRTHKLKKKRKTQQSSRAARVDRSVPLTLRYAYSRRLSDDGTTTLVEFRVTSCVGDASKPAELVHIVLRSTAPYPRSYYEDNNGGMDDVEEEVEEDGVGSDGEDERSGSEAEKGEQKHERKGKSSSRRQDAEREAGEDKEDDDDDACASCDSHDGDDEDADGDGEAIEVFSFGESAVEEILAWFDEDGVDPADAIGFFLALPLTEDEWQLDERITEIVFSRGSDDEGDDDSEGDE